MKIKSIIQLKDRLDRVTEAQEFGDQDRSSSTIRYDVYEEAVSIEQEDGGTVTLTVSEAKRLQTALSNLL